MSQLIYFGYLAVYIILLASVLVWMVRASAKRAAGVPVRVEEEKVHLHRRSR